MQTLAEEFRDSNFSIHNVIKTIMKSNAYQLSTSFPGEWTEAYVPYHARRFARTFTPVEAIDVVAQATASGLGLRQFGEQLSYIKEMNNPTRGGGDISPFLAAYYQGDRRLAPQNVNVSSAVQAMMMMSSPIVNDRVVAEGSTRVATLLESGSSDDEIIEELFLSSLSRWPTAEEVTVARRLLAEDRRTGAEDIQWALLNAVEFVVNH